MRRNIDAVASLLDRWDRLLSFASAASPVETSHSDDGDSSTASRANAGTRHPGLRMMQRPTQTSPCQSPRSAESWGTSRCPWSVGCVRVQVCADCDRRECEWRYAGC